MRSLQLNLLSYDSDKITNHYLERYDPMLEPWVEKSIVLLELGVHKGGSLLLWRDYFPRGEIVGIDVSIPKDVKFGERIHVYEGNQIDLEFLSQVAHENAPNGFDIIIDDASHRGEFTRMTFWHLFDNHLGPNGLYVIDDWGTGYWDEWPDGKRLDLESYSRPQRSIGRFLSKLARKVRLKIPLRGHNYGMVGFIKQLIDEQGAHDITRGEGRLSKFQSILVVPSLVFVRKAEQVPRAVDRKRGVP